MNSVKQIEIKRHFVLKKTLFSVLIGPIAHSEHILGGAAFH